MLARTTILWATAAVALLAGCGPDACTTLDATSACGGDVAGTWTLVTYCYGHVKSCPAQYIDDHTGSYERIELGPGNRASWLEAQSGSYVVHTPASCISGINSCAEWNTVAQDVGTLSCDGTPATGCDCTFTYSPNWSRVRTGTYTVDNRPGDATVSIDDNGWIDTRSYCRHDDILVIGPSWSNSVFPYDTIFRRQ